MGDGDFVGEHLNAFNTIVTYSISLGVKMDEEDGCMALFFFFSIFIAQPDNFHWKHRKDIVA